MDRSISYSIIITNGHRTNSERQVIRASYNEKKKKNRIQYLAARRRAK